MKFAEKHFSNPKLGHHVCHILKNSDINKEMTIPMSPLNDHYSTNALPKLPKSKELFDILAEAEKTDNPAKVLNSYILFITIYIIKVLLIWSRNLAWRILAVIAACYSGVCLLSCLTTWLGIGNELSSVTDDIASVIFSEDNKLQNIDELINQVII